MTKEIEEMEELLIEDAVRRVLVVNRSNRYDLKKSIKKVVEVMGIKHLQRCVYENIKQSNKTVYDKNEIYMLGPEYEYPPICNECGEKTIRDKTDTQFFCNNCGSQYHDKQVDDDGTIIEPEIVLE